MYRALSAVSEGAGLAVGAVAASVTFAPPAPNNADAAAAAAVAAALRARGWCALTPGVFIDAHDYATAAPGVPRACAVARIVRASVRAPNNLLLTVNVGISRFKPVSPAAVALLPGSGAYGEVGSDGDAAFAGRALDGYVCCMLPDLWCVGWKKGFLGESTDELGALPAPTKPSNPPAARSRSSAWCPAHPKTPPCWPPGRPAWLLGQERDPRPLRPRRTGSRSCLRTRRTATTTHATAGGWPRWQRCGRGRPWHCCPLPPGWLVVRVGSCAAWQVG